MGEFLIVSVGVLGFFFTVTAFICWVNTLSPAFERSLSLGLLCFLPPIAYLWGFAKRREINLEQNFLVWSVSLIPAIIFLIYVPQMTDYLGSLI